jgi:hypothetical protein
MQEFKWFLIALLGLWILWAASGGYSHIESKDKELLRQPAPIQDWQPYKLQELKR